MVYQLRCFEKGKILVFKLKSNFEKFACAGLLFDGWKVGVHWHTFLFLHFIIGLCHKLYGHANGRIFSERVK